MENSAIEWTDHTFNPWSGCTKVSPGCANCYAESMAQRFPALGNWGPDAERKRTSEANWRKPLAWNRATAQAIDDAVELFEPSPPRPRVFCASLADWLDPEVPAEWLADLLALIAATPHLDWLLLTKRPELWQVRLEAVVWWAGAGWRGCPCTPGRFPTSPTGTASRSGAQPGGQGRYAGSPEHKSALFASGWLNGKQPANVWVGTSVEDQRRADERIPALLSIPARVRFLSCEPLLGPVILDAMPCDPLRGVPRVDWVIAGGESGPGARPMHPDWARSLRDQCQEAGVPFFFKQWGAWVGGTYSVDHPTPSAADVGGASAVHGWGRGVFSARVGKKAAGRLLDGRTWDEVPS